MGLPPALVCVAHRRRRTAINSDDHEHSSTPVPEVADLPAEAAGEGSKPGFKPLTIAEFTDNYGPGHSGLLYAVQFVEEQVLAAGHRLLVVAPVADGPNPFAGHERRREIRLPSVPLPGNPVRISMGQDFDYRLAQLVANPPDVIHVHGLGGIGLLGMWVAQRANRPLIITWHTDFEAYADHYWHFVPLLNAAYKVYTMHMEGVTWKKLRKTIRFQRPRRGRAQIELLQVAAGMLTDADLVTTPSDKTAKRVLEIAPSAHVRVVPNGTDALPELPPVPKGPGPRLLYVGRIAVEKGIDLMLDGFELVRDHIPDAELMLVGDWKTTQPSLRRQLKQAARHGGVKLVGQVPRERLGAYYASADLFLFTSTTDTQALVLHEAAHAGLPFVSVDHELRMVMDPGVNTMFSRPNPVSLAGTIIEMLRALQDPEFKARATARSKEMAARYTIANQSREFVEIYEQIAAGEKVRITDGIEPDFARPFFGNRKVTATFEHPPIPVD